MFRKKDRLSLLARFVVDAEGRRIGESISIFEDMIIIKKGGDYYAIPLKHVSVDNDNIRVRGIIQWDRAKELAKRWIENV
ncbi:MAG: hypothetical protein J7K61_02795 [Thermoplasmata archaeon]|nr:hypothetical protein [Thermoplasmata archaeon]